MAGLFSVQGPPKMETVVPLFLALERRLVVAEVQLAFQSGAAQAAQADL